MSTTVSKSLVALGAGAALAASLVAVALTLQQPAEGKVGKSSKARVARAKLVNADGDRVGRVSFSPVRGGAVLVRAHITDAEPGFHGFHVHETGECDADAPDGAFTTAGGHLSRGHQSHGEHAGDMPSLLVLDDGNARLRFETDLFRMSDLFDKDGSAAMVHEGPDNFANIPERYVSSTSGEPGPDEETLSTGDAGARFACGVVERDGRR